MKKDGRLEPFQKEKIINGCVNSGASREIAEKIANEVESKASDRMPTSQIKEIVLAGLERDVPEAVATFNAYVKPK